jgi:hypothetical protein
MCVLTSSEPDPKDENLVAKVNEAIQFGTPHEMPPTIDRELDQYLEMLFPKRSIDPRLQQEACEDRLVPGTATWIFDDPKYVEWERKAGSFLSITGQGMPFSKPLMSVGCGKTHLVYLLQLVR